MTEEGARKFARNLAHIRGLRGEDIVDAEQDAVIKWSRVTHEHEGYQKQTVSNAVMDYMRTWMRQGNHMAVVYDDIYEPIDSRCDYRAFDDREAARDQINRLLDFCRKDEREAVKLLCMGFTSEESAAVMGISWTAFKTRLHRLRKRWNASSRKNVI